MIGDNHKGEILYGWGKCCDFVWKGFGDKETHSKYTGDVGNGVPNGFGIMIFPNGNKYIGDWKDGKAHGQGTKIHVDNSNLKLSKDLFTRHIFFPYKYVKVCIL